MMNASPMGMSQQLPQYNLGPLQQQANALSQQIQALQQMGMPQQQPPQQTSHIQYVNGIESAKAYIVQPNSSALLMDSERPRFYVKSSDASGFCTVKAFDFSEVKEEAPETGEYVTKSEFDALKRKIESYEQMFGATKTPEEKPAQKGKTWEDQSLIIQKTIKFTFFATVARWKCSNTCQAARD